MPRSASAASRINTKRPARVAVADAELAQSGVRPPQQARSRAAFQRLLASAEYVLVNDGIDEFTIARVAEHAGVSVGGVYRRFASKEQLLDAVRYDLLRRLENSVVEALSVARPSLAGVLGAFCTALSEILAESGRVIPAILAGRRSADSSEQGLRILAALQRRFLDAAAPHHSQIRHRDPTTALDIAFRSVIAASAHRAAIDPWWPDNLTWSQWAAEVADMTTAYLTTRPQSDASAT
jgi:AcrR family transcriptional regulator